MPINPKKSDKITFGYFRNEKKAEEYIEHYKKFRMKKGVEPNFFVVKRDRKKAGQKSFEAYCLIPR